MGKGKKKAVLTFFLYFIVACLMFPGAFAPCASADVIIDNGDPGTSFTGSWPVSGGTNPYGGDSFWSRDGTTYTWELGSQPAGRYEVLMWWSGWSSRAPIVPVDIQHADGVDYLFVNQRENAGQWNSLGTYYFDGEGSVMVTAAYGASVSTCADAVWFKYIPEDSPPTAVIDSISPNPAVPGQTVSFSGHGEVFNGSVESCVWESDIDGILSYDFSFSTPSLSQGSHVISFLVSDDMGASSEPVTRTLVIQDAAQEVIIDNSGPGTSSSGTWYVSGGSGAYGSNSLWSRDGTTYTWSFSPAASAYYEVSMWWTQYSSRSTAIPVRIEHYSNGVTASTVAVNQQINGGKWNSLGTYYYEAGRSYRVTITSQPYPTSTCADAVRFVQADGQGGTAPVAGFAGDKTSGSAPCTISFFDQSIGTVTGRLWNFGDGTTSTQKDPVHVYNQAGTFRVTLTASNDYGSDTMARDAYIQVYTAMENIYLCDGYSKNALFLPRCYDYLKRLGATEQNGVWVYRNAAKGITYNIYSVRTPAAMEQALKQEGAHIIFNGHSNFGFGATFATSRETQNQQMDNVFFVDDDRFANYSTMMVSVKPDGMKYGQAYPNWNPIFKNGKSALMPYDFSQGTPPYNYYLTYTIPGDPVTYKVELSNGSYLERFPDSNTPAWFSPDGSPPDPVRNPEYFITNSDPDFNHCDLIGTWPIGKIQGGGYMGESGYLGYNYQYHSAGTGSNKAVFSIFLRYSGNYEVLTSWFPSASNATNAKYIIHHAGGDATVEMNQQQPILTMVKSLGTYYFNQGTCRIEINDNANGRVVADAIALNCKDNPDSILQAEFDTDAVSGSAPLAVKFIDQSLANNVTITSRLWDFGDGVTSTEKNPQHTYEQPGIYTVSLKVIASPGMEQTEVKESFIVVDSTAPLHAEFTAPARNNAERTIVKFKDRSSGIITARHWDFGDGSTSNEQNPTHVYTDIGSFTVRLTVSGPGGNDTETETAYVCNMVAIEFVDNTFHERPHFYSGSLIKFGKVICDTGTIKIPAEEMRYSRMFYGGCNSSNYYVGAFNRGIFFFTRADTDEVTAPEYLRRYLMGDTDNQILARLNAIEPVYEYYNFNLKPPSMR